MNIAVFLDDRAQFDKAALSKASTPAYIYLEAGGALPETLKLVTSIRPTGATHHMARETLTHAGIGSAGL